jgi:hypothetical protein
MKIKILEHYMQQILMLITSRQPDMPPADLYKRDVTIVPYSKASHTFTNTDAWNVVHTACREMQSFEVLRGHPEWKTSGCLLLIPHNLTLIHRQVCGHFRQKF